MKNPNKDNRDKRLVNNDLKHSGDSIDKLRMQEEANSISATKEIGQANENL